MAHRELQTCTSSKRFLWEILCGRFIYCIKGNFTLLTFCIAYALLWNLLGSKHIKPCDSDGFISMEYRHMQNAY
jgi:hypothetical protein